MTAYYNEIDPYAAQWLRNLINAGHIAPGIVDERSIEDVYPSDLRGFTQCHFFAGIGVWSHALRSAGWSDERPVWTGSCPCQPFSAAGKGAGFDDERHLWPAFHHLIKECQPTAVLGEQVASKDSDPWIDLVHTDLEALGYAFGAIPFPSAGVGAPHIRDRLYWVAHTDGGGHDWGGVVGPRRRLEHPNSSSACDLGNTERAGLAFGLSVAGISGRTSETDEGQATERTGVHAGGMAVANKVERRRRAEDAKGQFDWEASRRDEGDCKPAGRSDRGIQGSTDTSPTNGYWRNADWLYCRDGRWRPVEPGTFPLAHGAPTRVGRLRAYGNAINAKAAQVFIECVMDCTP